MIQTASFLPLKILEGIKQTVDRFSLDTTSILHGCYALRFPLFHFIGIFHPDAKYPLVKRFGDLTFLASDLVGGLLWFQKLGVIKIFKVTLLLPLNRVTIGLRGISYLFYGAHAIKELKGAEKVQAVLDLSAAVAQVALAVLLVVGVTHAAVITLFTVLAYGLTSASVAYPIAMTIKDLYLKLKGGPKHVVEKAA